jgi:hypothetical protein
VARAGGSVRIGGGVVAVDAGEQPVVIVPSVSISLM